MATMTKKEAMQNSYLLAEMFGDEFEIVEE